MTDEEKAAQEAAEKKAREKEKEEEEERRQERAEKRRARERKADEYDWGQDITELSAELDNLKRALEKRSGGLPWWAVVLPLVIIGLVAAGRWIASRKGAES